MKQEPQQRYVQSYVEKLAYNADEIAVSLGISVRYVRELIAKGKLKSKKLGKRRLVSRQHLLEFLEDRTE